MRKKSGTEKDITPGIIISAPWRLIKVSPMPDYELVVTFVDGLNGIVKMKNLIFSDNAGVFSVLKDKLIFDQVSIEHGVTTWQNEIDLAPDAMYEAIKKDGYWVI